MKSFKIILSMYYYLRVYAKPPEILVQNRWRVVLSRYITNICLPLTIETKPSKDKDLGKTYVTPLISTKNEKHFFNGYGMNH